MSRTKRDWLRKTRLRMLMDMLDLFPLRRTQGKGKPLHAFVSGLIFSFGLIEEIRKDLPPKYSVDWGHILDETKDVFSKEADIIVYEGKPYHEWKAENFRYVIVPKGSVRAVMECRAWLEPGPFEGSYRDLSQFASDLYAVAERCWAKEESTVRERCKAVKAFGYRDVFCLCRLYDEEKELRYEDWNRLLETVRSL